MQKISRKHLDHKLIKLSLILGLIYFMLFNTIVLAHKFGYYKATALKAIVELSKDAIYIYGFTVIIFLGLTINRLAFIIGSIFLFITGAIASYYLLYFKIPPSKEVMVSFFSTHFNELYELTSIKLLVWLAFSLFACIYSIKHFSFTNSKLFTAKLLSATCLLITINNIITPQFKILNSYFPIQYLHNSYLYLSKNKIKLVGQENINEKFSFIDKSDENITVILVIGESARFDHFGINGYHRNTTPILSSIDNLFSFKAQSASNHTYLSVPSLMSRYAGRDLDKSLEETSVLSVFTKLGFNTNWIGTQTLLQYLKSKKPTTIYDEVNFAMLPGGSALLKMNDLDEKMLPYVSDLLNANVGKQVIVIHTSGSHWNYSSRYPKEFQKFSPGCNAAIKADSSSCGAEELINNYDNSILYTDFFLSSIVGLLKERNAFLIYVSDHGESLGEGGYYGHGGPLIKEQTTIPFMVWVSDKFKNRHPNLVQSIEKHLDKEIHHDYVFHSILDCAGISSEAIDKNLSLCGKNSRATNKILSLHRKKSGD
ncbi:MAG: sulfatase-like hydrolase/transferase [Rickettsia endosymbiont of Bryobia graminum]|nr:sulfatase-like hydrolase/transferase [Rickettsia endosymbiont of Bryobia graminum]